MTFIVNLSIIICVDIKYFLQAYRSGHNEAVLKTVWVKAHGGSNPSACAIKKRQIFFCLFFMEQSEVSTVLRIIGGFA